MSRLGYILSLFCLALVARAGRDFATASLQGGYVYSAPYCTWPLTVSTWAYVGATNQSHAVWSLQTNTTGGDSHRLMLYCVGSSGFSGQWALDRSHATTRILGPAIVPNTWYHVAATGTAENNYILYVNGVAVGTNTTAHPSGYLLAGDTYDIGNRWSSGFGQYWQGRIAEFAVWNVELSAGQVAALAAGADPRTVSATAPRCYIPMLGENSPELGWSGQSLTLTNAPVKGAHPPVTHP